MSTLFFDKILLVENPKKIETRFLSQVHIKKSSVVR